MKASQRRISRTFTVRTPDQRDVLTCTRKTKITNKQTAKNVAARAAREGKKLHIYECPVCHHYHLTNSDQAVERERRRA